MLLKGGLVLERRIERARTTKDVDLRLSRSPSGILDELQAAGRLDLGDFMRFEIVTHDDHPEIKNDGMRYDGLRFRAECKLVGKRYGHPFGIDVVFGEPIFGEPDILAAEDHLAFAGIAPPIIRIQPIETHIAEKLHAYTMPRVRPNSRVKDLPDIALLATAQALDAKRLLAALTQTFAFRDTHALPARFADPSSAWAVPYAAMAREDELAWPTLGDVLTAARAFLDPRARRRARRDLGPRDVGVATPLEVLRQAVESSVGDGPLPVTSARMPWAARRGDPVIPAGPRCQRRARHGVLTVTGSSSGRTTRHRPCRRPRRTA